MSASGPASWSTSFVKKLGRIHGGAGKRVTGGHTRGRQRLKDANGIARGIATGTLFTSPSTTRPVWPTPKCCPTGKRPRPSRSCAARSGLRPSRHHRRARDHRQRLPSALAHTPSPAASWASGTSARGPTGPDHGKAERFIRTLLGGWAYGAIYSSSRERTAALDGWLFTYNHRRRHSAIGRQAPISRLNNLLGLTARGRAAGGAGWRPA